ncbi:hypothetical protein Tco_1163801 [Tanacetum coccineum]
MAAKSSDGGEEPVVSSSFGGFEQVAPCWPNNTTGGEPEGNVDNSNVKNIMHECPKNGFDQPTTTQLSTYANMFNHEHPGSTNNGFMPKRDISVTNRNSFAALSDDVTDRKKSGKDNDVSEEDREVDESSNETPRCGVN